MSDTSNELIVLRLCVDCKNYRNHQCQRNARIDIALTTGTVKTIGAIDALQERKSYHAYRCGPSGRYWNNDKA